MIDCHNGNYYAGSAIGGAKVQPEEHLENAEPADLQCAELWSQRPLLVESYVFENDPDPPSIDYVLDGKSESIKTVVKYNDLPIGLVCFRLEKLGAEPDSDFTRLLRILGTI